MEEKDVTLEFKDEDERQSLASEIARTYNTGFMDGLIIGMHTCGCSLSQICDRLHMDDKDYISKEIEYYKLCLEDNQSEFLGECPAKWVEPQQ